MNTRPVPFPSALAADSLKHFHRRPPLIHCLTNDVVQSFTANVLLALGASPAMVVAGFCALPGDRLQHIAAACAVMSECGQRAANGAGGPGSFILRFLDQLFMAMEATAK
ncbi:hydroxyethylthiazole kinase [Lonsdalea quercina]|uniref:hydroxyethylthiazole kinase n=1 Tax=Lonsdalea quercina TaxID=71657 RepID=UPI0039767DCC